jgi:hypothetical protein
MWLGSTSPKSLTPYLPIQHHSPSCFYDLFFAKCLGPHIPLNLHGSLIPLLPKDFVVFGFSCIWGKVGEQKYAEK